MAGLSEKEYASDIKWSTIKPEKTAHKIREMTMDTAEDETNVKSADRKNRLRLPFFRHISAARVFVPDVDSDFLIEKSPFIDCY